MIDLYPGQPVDSNVLTRKTRAGDTIGFSYDTLNRLKTKTPPSPATAVNDWPFSSFHRMVKPGIYPEDWAGDVSNGGADFGERP